MLYGKYLLKLVSLFVEDYSHALNLQPHTIKNKRNSLNRLLKYLQDQPFTYDTVTAYFADLSVRGVMPSSIGQELKVIRAFTSFLVKRKYLKENFAKDIPIPKIKKEIKNFIKEEDAEKVIILGTEIKKDDNKLATFVKGEMRVALRFILRTGIRISEACKMRGKDLCLDDAVPFFYVVGKGGNKEVVPLPLDMLGELRTRVKKERVFTIREDTCNRALKRGCEVLGLPPTKNHYLRHIFSLSRLRRREPLQFVSRVLRHSSISITDQYYSQFVLSDTAPVVNNSVLIQGGLSVEQTFERIQRAIASTGVESDKRFKIVVLKNVNKIVIEIVNQ